MSDDAGTQYVPLNKTKVYNANVQVNNILRKINYSSQFSLTENIATDSVDIGVNPNIFALNQIIDVNYTGTPADKDVLRFNGTGWTNQRLVLNDIQNIIISGPVSGQAIVHNGTNFVNQNLNLDALSDVAITTPANGHIIQHNGTQFVNVAPSAGIQALDDLTDVTITSPIDNQVIRRSGSEWVNASLDSERVGKSTASGNAVTTTFNITHGLGSNPTYAFVDCSSHAIARTFTTTSTIIAVTFATAPPTGTNNVIIYWRVVA